MISSERASLTGYLQYQRVTPAMKCSGLTTSQLRSQVIPPSGLSLLGLVRHVAEVERIWFQVVWNGEDVAGYWPGKVNGTFAEFAPDWADPDEAFKVWHTACAHPHPHDRGVRPAQRPRRPAARADRRIHRSAPVAARAYECNALITSVRERRPASTSIW
jgi:hypothetical protein